MTPTHILEGSHPKDVHIGVINGFPAPFIAAEESLTGAVSYDTLDSELL
jgi:hypothetical protein